MNKIFSSSDPDALGRLREKNQRDIGKTDGKVSAEAESRSEASSVSRSEASSVSRSEASSVSRSEASSVSRSEASSVSRSVSRSEREARIAQRPKGASSGFERASSEKRLRAAAESNGVLADEVAAVGNRLALRHERTLQGLLAVRALFEHPADDREAQLEALIEQTRFQDEPVLADFAKTLRFAVRDSDRAALDYLVRDFQDKLQSSARDQVIRENLQAASSLMPADLLKDVVRALKNEGVPQIAIARQRVLELLRPV